jgi:hypothetical protein
VAVASAAPPALDQGHHRALGEFVAELDLHFLDHAGDAARHVHRRLVGFEGDQGVVDLTVSPTATQTSMTGTS